MKKIVSVDLASEGFKIQFQFHSCLKQLNRKFGIGSSNSTHPNLKHPIKQQKT